MGIDRSGVGGGESGDRQERWRSGRVWGTRGGVGWEGERVGIDRSGVGGEESGDRQEEGRGGMGRE